MNKSHNRNPKVFSGKKVSLNRVMNTLESKGISIDEDQAKMILDFLYLIAKTYSIIESNKNRVYNPNKKSNNF